MSKTDTHSGAGKIALVTGAAGTMGGVVAQGLIDEGYRVVAADVRQADVERAARELGNDTYPIAFDVSDYQACRTAVETIQREVGDPSVLVNNAGILAQNKVAGTTPEEWRRVMSINLDGAFYLSQLCLPAMIAQKWGRIVNTSSYAAKSGGITAGTAYSVSKAALIGLTFSIAAETTKTGVTVNAIAPAYVRTPMVDKELSDEQRAEVIKKIPVGRYCEPEEFAHVVNFLVSPLAGFITGEVIDQNGGFHFD
ncbi:MAG: SDR family NAD(P)-dependent oxidoreductase [Alkalispirochaeta sp.]